MSGIGAPWTSDMTMLYLNENPLPSTFRWEHRDGGQRPVQPSHKSITGYGKWLRETPYFQGLFELVHSTLVAADAAQSEAGGPEWLAEEIAKMKLRIEQEKLPLF